MAATKFCLTTVWFSLEFNSNYVAVLHAHSLLFSTCLCLPHFSCAIIFHLSSELDHFSFVKLLLRFHLYFDRREFFVVFSIDSIFIASVIYLFVIFFCSCSSYYISVFSVFVHFFLFNWYYIFTFRFFFFNKIAQFSLSQIGAYFHGLVYRTIWLMLHSQLVWMLIFYLKQTDCISLYFNHFHSIEMFIWWIHRWVTICHVWVRHCIISNHTVHTVAFTDSIR